MKNFIITYLTIKFIEKIIEDGFKKQDEIQEVISFNEIIQYGILANIPLISKYYK